MTTKEKIAVMQAFEDGKTIQQDYHGDWVDIDVPVWNWGKCDYRVKPEPQLRPYKDAAEFLQAQQEHGLYIEIDCGAGWRNAMFTKAKYMPHRIKINCMSILPPTNGR